MKEVTTSVSSTRTIDNDEVSITTTVTEQTPHSEEPYLVVEEPEDICNTARQMGERLIEIHEDLYGKYKNYK